jgi:hypothetical protein
LFYQYQVEAKLEQSIRGRSEAARHSVQAQLFASFIKQ